MGKLSIRMQCSLFPPLQNNGVRGERRRERSVGGCGVWEIPHPHNRDWKNPCNTHNDSPLNFMLLFFIVRWSPPTDFFTSNPPINYLHVVDIVRPLQKDRGIELGY